MKFVQVLKKSLQRLWQHRSVQMVWRFAIVSSGTAILNLSVANVLIELLDVHYKLAMVAGFVVQVSTESAFNRSWTFRAEHLHYWLVLALTATIELACFGISYKITEFGVEELRLDFTLVRIASMTITGCVSLAGAWLLTFRRQLKKRPQ